MPTAEPIELTDRQICDALTPYSVSPSDDLISKIREYMRLLIRWNRSISLTSIKEPIEILGRHFGESMFASHLLAVENCRLVDIGTGAGFPGLALKINNPGIQVILVESNRKKCAFLSEVVRELDLADVEIRAERFEQMRPSAMDATIITSRAVGEFKKLLRWSRSALTCSGHVVLWVGSDDSARIASSPGWTWMPPIRIPDSQRRFVLMGRALGNLPSKAT
jgi:16S rRNA (guanine527-N7)-methyltransferase